MGLRLSLSVAWFAGAMAANSVAGGYTMEPGAFLRRPVFNVGALVRQVRNDGDVSRAYQRHFGFSERQVVNYFETLHLEPLRSSAKYDIFTISARGNILRDNAVLPEGAVVFADPYGAPILKRTSGNPLVSDVRLSSPDTPAITDSPTVQTAPVDVADANAPQSELVAVFQPPASPYRPVIQPDTVLSPALSAPVGVAAGGFAIPSALYATPLLAVLAMSHSGGGVGSPDGEPGHPSSPPAGAVPEPATLVVLAAGIATLMRRRSRS